MLEQFIFHSARAQKDTKPSVSLRPGYLRSYIIFFKGRKLFWFPNQLGIVERAQTLESDFVSDPDSISV